MAFFKDTPGEWRRLDWQILQNGWATLYWQPDILKNDIGWLGKEGYKVIDFDCTNWSDENILHNDLKDGLNFLVIMAKI